MAPQPAGYSSPRGATERGPADRDPVDADRARPLVEQHGTRSRYVTRGCRCATCRAANAEYQREADARRRAELAAGLVVLPHGSVSTYGNWGCRCGACTAAMSRKNREAYERRHPS